MSSDQPALTALAEKVMAAANRQRGREPSPEFREAIKPMFEAESGIRKTLHLRLATIIPQITSASGAGLTAMCFGAAVENGADPNESFRPLFSTLIRWARTLPVEPEPGETGAIEPIDLTPHEDTLIGLEYLGQSLVAHVGRDKSLKASIAPNSEAIAHLYRVEHLSVGLMWVLTLLRQCSGDLLVLHATEAKGAWVKYENIANCFHLFTLLQGALANVMPGARTPSPQALAAATRQGNDRIPDSAWWHYGKAEFTTPDLTGSVFGEDTPKSISQFDGQQVILLWPPILQHRGWDSSFFSPLLQASLPSLVLTRQLSAEEISQWRARLQLPQIANKPFWKVWK